MQEAMIHLWFIETREPGHTLSWYLQSCLFHLKNHLSAGRSVDSVKRPLQPDLLSADLDSAPFEVVGEDSIHSEVIGREIVVMLKKALDPLDQAILAHLAEGVRHLGPVAQDFHAAFGLGESETAIGTVDADGVALAAVQGLNEVVKEKDAQIQALREKNQELELRLKTLESRVDHMHPKSSAGGF